MSNYVEVSERRYKGIISLAIDRLDYGCFSFAEGNSIKLVLEEESKPKSESKRYLLSLEAPWSGRYEVSRHSEREEALTQQLQYIRAFADQKAQIQLDILKRVWLGFWLENRLF